MRLIFILIILGICAILVVPSFANSDRPMEQGMPIQEMHQLISQDEIVNLTDEFMNILVQETDEDYQVKAYEDKASLLQAFYHITTEEVVKPYVDTYYYEQNGALYIIPTETPPWFDKQNDYDVLQLEENKILVKQENQSDLYGAYRIDLELTYATPGWKITKITHH